MRFDGRVEFEPPSDFIEESGGGGGRSWFKIFGIGCAVIVLIIGLITAAGIIKGVSCCGDLKTVGENTIGAITYGTQFAATLQDQNFEQAHGMMTADLQGKMDVAALSSKFSQPWLASATLLDQGLQGGNNQHVDSIDEIKDIQTWDMRMRMYPQQGKEQLITTVGVKIDKPAEGDQPATFAIYHVDVHTALIDFKTEPPAQTVLGFHGRLQSGDIDGAYRIMNPQSQEGGLPTFRAFIDEQGELFTRSVMEIEEVRYPRNDAAVVTARLETTSGNKAIVTYQVSPGMSAHGWRIDGVTPLIQTDLDEPGVDPGEKIDEEGARVKEDGDAENQADTEGSLDKGEAPE